MIRRATPADSPHVERLLRQAGLPTAGLEGTDVWVLDDGGVTGAVGIERHGQTALVRSLVVAPEARGAGAGAALLEHALVEAGKAGARRAAALTTTIAAWLEREGWVRVARAELPRELEASPELQGACPASAACFVRTLQPGTRAA